ncbi:polycystin-1-like [Leptodactylus fuscus]|uniref:polycystin-1-like n=1 Tax=Leptodactylus fuscus TaxID=238119 RepID=UPI003F4F2DBC
MVPEVSIKVPRGVYKGAQRCLDLSGNRLTLLNAKDFIGLNNIRNLYRTHRYRTHRYRTHRYRTHRYRSHRYRSHRYRSHRYRSHRYRSHRYRSHRYRSHRYRSHRYRSHRYRSHRYRSHRYRSHRYRSHRYHTHRYHTHRYHTHRYHTHRYHTHRYHTHRYHTHRYHSHRYHSHRYHSHRYHSHRYHSHRYHSHRYHTHRYHSHRYHSHRYHSHRYHSHRYHSHRYHSHRYRTHRYRTHRYRTHRYRTHRYRTHRYRSHRYRSHRYRSHRYRSHRYHSHRYHSHRYHSHRYHTHRYHTHRYHTHRYHTHRYHTHRYHSHRYHSHRYHSHRYHSHRYHSHRYHSHRYHTQTYHTHIWHTRITHHLFLPCRNLSHNQIWMIDEFWILSLPELRILDLSGNRLPCACPLHRFISHLAAEVRLVMDPESERCVHDPGAPAQPCYDYVSCLRGPLDCGVRYSVVTLAPFSAPACLALCFRHGYPYYSRDDTQRCLCGSVMLQVNGSCLERCSRSAAMETCHTCVIHDPRPAQVTVSLSATSHFSVFQTSGFLAEASAPVQQYLWEFQDGGNSVVTAGGAVTHKYSLPGHYRVKVKAEGREPGAELLATMVVPLNSAELQCPMVAQTGQSLEVWLRVTQGTHLQAVYGVHQQGAHHVTDDSSCPRGGRIFPGDLYCYWLSPIRESWVSAHQRCSSVPGGDLAYITSSDQRAFIQETFSGNLLVWVNVSRWSSVEQDLQEDCAVLPLIPGTMHQWTPCMEKAPSLCRCRGGVQLPDAPVYLVGVSAFHGADTENTTLSTLHEDLASDIEVMMFPGLWFSHSGFPLSLELGIQPLQRDYQARVQILRPFCSPEQHLLPPGCVFQPSPFATCHAHPLCNTTGVCPNGKQWCPLIERCQSRDRPCSTYTPGSAKQPPRYVGTPPLYSPVTDIPLTISASHKSRNLQVLLSHLSYTVHPDDILSIQHTGVAGSFLRCVSSSDSPWRQSYVTLTHGGWLRESARVDSAHWVDDVVCDLHVLYGSEAHSLVVSPLLWGFQDAGAYTVSAVLANAVSSTTATCEVNVLSPVTDVQIVHPTPSNGSLYLRTQEDNLVVVSARSSGAVHAHWVTSLQSGESIMQPECPSDVASSLPICAARPADVRFSWLLLHFDSPQSTELSIQVTNGVSMKSITVPLRVYDAIQGLQIHTGGSNHIEINQTQVFTAGLSHGSSVTFTWTFDPNDEEVLYRGPSYAVTFRAPGDYRLKVVVENPVSSQEAAMTVHVDGNPPSLQAQIFLFSTLLLVAQTHEMSLKIRLDRSTDVTISWDFGDGGPLVTRHFSPPYDVQNLREPLANLNTTERHLYTQPGNYQVIVTASQGGAEVACTQQVQLVPPLTSLTLAVDHSSLRLHTAARFSAFCRPSSLAVTFMWEFGDETGVVRSRNQQIEHVYKWTGRYKVSVTATDGLSHINRTVMVTIDQLIDGLQVWSNSPTELGTEVTVSGSVTQGTNIIWTFDMGDGKAYINQSEASVTHTYSHWGQFMVGVTARNVLSATNKSLTVQIYRIQVTHVLPDITTSLISTKWTAYLSRPSKRQTLHWDFGDGTPAVLMEGVADVWHTYGSAGNYTITLFMSGDPETDLYSKVIMVEDKITSMTISLSPTSANVSQPIAFRAMVQPPPDQGHLYWYQWDFGLGLLSINTSSSEVTWSYMSDGHYNVTATVWNQVSQHQAWSLVTVQQPILSLSMEHNGGTYGIPRGVDKMFTAKIIPEVAAQFTWNFGDSTPACYGQNVTHTFQVSGNLTVSVYAKNNVSHQEATYSLSVQGPIVDLSVKSDVVLAKCNQTVQFYTTLSSGEDVQYFWSMCESCPYRSGTANTSHSFMYPGSYRVKVQANNTVSSAHVFLTIDIQEQVQGVSIRQERAQVVGYAAIGERLTLTAHVTKGSNVTFHWVLVPGPLESHNASITFHPLELGDLFLEVWVENALGRVYAWSRVQVIERISGVTIQKPADPVAIGTTLDLTILVRSGTEVSYTWDLGEGANLHAGRNKSITLSYATQGLKVITVVLSNALSLATASTKLIVQESLSSLRIAIDGVYNCQAAPSRQRVLLCGTAEHGTEATWEWRLSGLNENITYNAQNVWHVFKEAGEYEVALTAYNSVSNATISYILLVQDPITGLKVGMGRSSVCTEQEVTFCLTIQYGTNVTFRLDLPRLNLSQVLHKPCHRLRFPFPGIYEVVSSAYNKVSLANSTRYVKVLENIKGLKVLGLPSSGSVERTMHLLAEVESGYLSSLQWSFQQEGQPALIETGQSVSYTPPVVGTLHILLNGSNHVCFSLVRSLVMVQAPVTDVSIEISSQEIFLHQCVIFRAIVSDGSDLHFQWTFPDTRMVGVERSVEHCYHDVGQYVTKVTVYNLVSVVHAYTRVRVIDCEEPLVWLEDSPSVIYRAHGGNFEAGVNLRDCYKYKVTYGWQVYNGSEDWPIPLLNVDTSNSLLTIPGHSLDIGVYGLRFTVTLHGTPISTNVTRTFNVAPSFLVAKIHGGSKLVWPAKTDLTLDGSKSFDPDEDDSDMKYEWSSAPEDTEGRSCFLKSLPDLPTITIPWPRLCGNISYSFTLTVWKPGRASAIATQTVFIHSGSVLPVYIWCLSCDFSSSVSHKTPVILFGECGGCHNQTLFRWSAVDSRGNALTLDEQTTTTGSAQPRLVVRRGSLQDNLGYTFTLHVIEQMGPGWGEGSIMLSPSHPPTGAQCSLHPTTGILGPETPLEYECTGWKDPDMGAQLFYLLSLHFCSITNCHKLYLYRGLKSWHRVRVPAAVEVGNIRVYIEVEDIQGERTLAINRSLVVTGPVLSGGVLVTQWWRSRSESLLGRIQLVGDNMSFLPLALEVMSPMKRDNNLTAEERDYSVHVYTIVTEVMSSRNVSSLWEVAAFSAALTLCAEHLPALDSALLHKILNFTQKMIQVLDREKNRGQRVEDETPGNLLTMLGALMTAPDSDSLPLYAFNLTRDFAVTLSKSHLVTEDSLTMKVPGVTIQARKRHPEDLLCSPSPCPGSKLRTMLHTLLDHQELTQLSIEMDNNPFPTGLFPNLSLTSQLVAIEYISPRGDSVPVTDLPAEDAIKVRLPIKKDLNLSPVSVTLQPRSSVTYTITMEEKTPRSAGIYLYIIVSRMNGSDWSCEESPELLVSYGPINSSYGPDVQKSLSLKLSLGHGMEQNHSLLLPSAWSRPTLGYRVNVTSLLALRPLSVSIGLFSSLCQYFHMPSQTWRTEGVTPSNGSLPHEAVCQTSHLTVFGAAIFVPPHRILFHLPAPRQWTLVLICCFGILSLYLLLVLISHKLDHLDVSRVGTIALCGPKGQYRYWVLVKTGWRRGAGTTAHVGICLYGVTRSGARHLHSRGGLTTGSLDMFQVESDCNLGEIWKIRVWHDNTGLDPSWFLQYVAVWDKQTDFLYFFVVNDWLSVDNDRAGGRLEKEILATCPQELSSFSHVFPAQLALGLTDWHLWLSVWWRPARSRFTRMQRVTCCALTLHLYMAACSLWYGAAGDRRESLPLGFQSAVTWPSICVGLLAALMVLPLQILFTFLFRETRSLVFVEDSDTSASVTEEEAEADSSSSSSSAILSFPGRDQSLPDLSALSCRSRTSSRFTFDLGKEEFWHLESSAPVWMSSSDSLYDIHYDIPLESSFSIALPLCTEERAGQCGVQSSCSSGDDPLSLSQSSSCSPLFTLSEENLLQSIAGDISEWRSSESDSGRFSSDPDLRSPSTDGGYGHISENTRMYGPACWSSSDQYVARRGSLSSSSVSNGTSSDAELQDCWDMSSASPSPFHTRIGIRWTPLGWLFPSGMLWVVYAVSLVIIGVCTVVTVLYVSSLAEHGFLLWLISCTCAALTSAVLLEPLRVVLLSLYYSLRCPPVLSEGLGLVEEPLVKKISDQSHKVRAPGGFSLLQAKEEARRVRALKTLIRSSTGYVIFLLLVLMMSFQGASHITNIRLLHSAIRRSITGSRGAEVGFTTMRSVPDLWHWLEASLPAHLYNDPRLTLVGSPRLCRYTSGLFPTSVPSQAVKFLPTDLCNNLTLGLNVPRDSVRCPEGSCHSLGNTMEATKEILQTLKNISWTDKSVLEVEISQYQMDVGLHISTLLQLNLSPLGLVASRLTVLPFHLSTVTHGLDLPMFLASSLLIAAICFLCLELAALKDFCTTTSSYSPDWTRLVIGLTSAATGFLHLSRTWLVKNVMDQYHAEPGAFISLYDVAELSWTQAALSAALLFLMMMKASQQLRFVRRWSIFGKTFQKLKWDILGCLLYITILFLALLHCVRAVSYMGGPMVFLRTLRHDVDLQYILERLPLVWLCLGSVLSVLCRGLLYSLILSVHRSIRADHYHQALEPQDHEMIDFLVKRLKLWLGVSKVKEYRHTVRFEGLDSGPSRTSPVSLCVRSRTVLSNRSESLHEDVASPSSPGPLCSSALAMEHLPTAVTDLLDRMDKVTAVLRDVYTLEQKLWLWQTLQQSCKVPRKEDVSAPDNPKLPLPRTYSTFSESALTHLRYKGPLSENVWMLPRAPPGSAGSRDYPNSAGTFNRTLLTMRRPHSEERSGVRKQNQVVTRPIIQKRRAWDCERSEEAT